MAVILGPVLHGSGHPPRSRAASRDTAGAAARDELVLDHFARIGGRSNTCRRSMRTSGASVKSAPHPPPGPGLVPRRLIRIGFPRQRRTRWRR
jgi:hypothetical protein